jgi:hypothetical protein
MITAKNGPQVLQWNFVSVKYLLLHFEKEITDCSEWLHMLSDSQFHSGSATVNCSSVDYFELYNLRKKCDRACNNTYRAHTCIKHCILRLYTACIKIWILGKKIHLVTTNHFVLWKHILVLCRKRPFFTTSDILWQLMLQLESTECDAV